MIRILTLLLFSSLLFANETYSNDTNETSLTTQISQTVMNDYKSFYTTDRMIRFGVAFSIGGIVANTSMDENIKNWYQDNVRSSSTDDVAKIAKEFGNGEITIPVALLCASVKLYEPDSIIGKWGAYTSRAYLVGAPHLLATQILTGGSRPEEKNHNSQWRPFQDDNGVSGHSFMGAVPFLTIARMYDDNPYIKYLAYAGSFFTAWSRVNDNAHYTSQAALGWYMAYESVDSVFDSDSTQKSYSIAPMFKEGGYGLQVSMRY